MVSLAGLSAAYPGYQTARQADNQIDKGDIDIQNAKLDQAGAEALGKTIQAFQASLPGAQPMPQAPPVQTAPPPQAAPPQQPPMPGQPSQPMGPPQANAPLPVRPVPTQSFTQPGAAPPQGQPPAAVAGLPGGDAGIDALRGKLDVRTLMGAIAKANPGAPPAVIAAAMNKALPLLNAQAQMDWKQAMMADRSARTDIAGGRLDLAGEEAARKTEQGNKRLEQGQTRLQQQQGEFASRDQRRQEQTRQGDVRLEQQAGREARLAAQAQVRQDQRWQQLEQQKAALAERIRSSGDRSQISQWRAIVDAQHKRAMEIIQSSNINANLPEADKKALIKEQNDFYESQIKQMREQSGNSTGRPAAADTRGQPEKPKVEDRVAPGTMAPQAAPPEAAASIPRPRAQNLQTGAMVEWDGKNWVPVAQ